MSEAKTKGVNAKLVFINVAQQIGIYQLCAKYKISDKSSILLAISKGLKEFGFMSEADFQKDLTKYGQPLAEKVEERKKQREKLKEAKSKAEQSIPKIIFPSADLEDFVLKNKLKAIPTAKGLQIFCHGLPNDTFKRLGEIAKSLNGHYVSEGNKTHFLIPKEGEKPK